MKVAIHHRENSFSQKWIEYCELKGIPYKLVDAYKSDIVEQLEGCDLFMWHSHHILSKDVLVSRKLLPALEKSGIRVYPDINTFWHFDDKIAQKYLLEAINEPLIPSYVFYDKNQALEWARKVSYPKVFKLKGGAGGSNVFLVKAQKECDKIIKKAFGKGISQFNGRRAFMENMTLFLNGSSKFSDVLKSLYRMVFPPKYTRIMSKEKDCVYFQDFIPNNDGDIRVIVIDGKFAYGMKRLNRENDFRASGSNNYVFESISKDILETAFRISKKLNLQSVAFDFVRSEAGLPVVIEMSYAFGTKGSSQCKGYWTTDLVWHEGEFEPQYWLMESLINELNNQT